MKKVCICRAQINGERFRLIAVVQEGLSVPEGYIIFVGRKRYTLYMYQTIDTALGAWNELVSRNVVKLLARGLV